MESEKKGICYMPNLLKERMEELDWGSILQRLDEQGYAELPVLLDKEQCREIISMYEEEALLLDPRTGGSC